MIDVLRFNLRSVVSSRLSTGLKNERLLVMCEEVEVLRSEMKEERRGSMGCAGGFQRTLFSIIGMVVEYRDGVGENREGVGKKKHSLSLR